MKKNYNEEIEAYLLQNLDDTAARDLERRAAADPELSAQIELERDIVKGIELAGDAALREKIAAADRRFFVENQQSEPLTVERGGLFSINFRYWAAAATVLLTLSAGIWWYSRPTEIEIAKKNKLEKLPEDPAALPHPEEKTATDVKNLNEKTPSEKTNPPKFEKKSTPAPQPDPRFLAMARAEWTSPDFSNIRSTNDAAATSISQAAAAFQKNDFQKVVDLLTGVPPSAVNFWQVSEILGHAEFRLGRVKTARARFQKIAESGALPFSERAEGALLLCLLADLPESQHDFDFLLKKILADEGHPNFALAQKLAASDVLKK